MKVPLFDMPRELAAMRPAIDQAITRVLDSGVFIGGPEVLAFENAITAGGHSEHAIGVSSGRVPCESLIVS